MEQSHHGRVGYEDNIPWNYTHTMAGELAKAGYYTQCIGRCMYTHCGTIWDFITWIFMTDTSTAPGMAVFPSGNLSLLRTIISIG